MKSIKKILFVLLAIILLLAGINFNPITMRTAHAETITTPDGIIFDKSTGTINGYTGTAAILDIQSSIDGVSVIKIGAYAFFSEYSLKSITLPNSITSIGDFGFSNCINLESIVLSNGLISLGKNVFTDCHKLKSVEIPESIKSIPEYTFSSCTSLVEVIIPNSVTSFGNAAFTSCSSLESIVLPYGVTKISNSMFYKCSKLSKVIIPSTVARIDLHAFNSCSSLSSITIPRSVAYIGSSSFISCSSLLTFYGYVDSYAQTYADEYNIPFKTISLAQLINQAESFNLLILDSGTHKPIINATVYNNILGTLITDSNGSVSFFSEQCGRVYKLDISKDGCYTTNIDIDFVSGESKTIYMYENTGGTIPQVLSFTNASSGWDILNEVSPPEGVSSADALLCTMQAASPAGNSIVEYRLLQDGITALSSADGTFSINFEEDFKPRCKIYAQAIDEYGNKSDPVELAYVYRPNAEFVEAANNGFSFGFGENMAITLPENIDLIGGKTIELGIKNPIPVDIEVDDSGLKFRVSVGMSGGFDSAKGDFNDVLNGIASIDSVSGGNNSFGAGFMSVGASIIGYGEGYIKDGTAYATLGLILDVNGEYVYVCYPFTPIPAYLKLGGGVGVTVSNSMTIGFKENGWEYNFNGLVLEPRVSLLVGVGLGNDGLISGGADGKATFSYLYNLDTKYHKAELSLVANIYAYLLGTRVVNVEIAEASWTLSEGYSNTTATTQNFLDAIYDEDNYTFLSRNTAGTNFDDTFTLNSITGSTNIDMNTFQNPLPRTIVHNGIPYIFWLKDNLSRDEENRSMLVYSKMTDGVWSAPIALYDDGTADFNFDVDVTSNTIEVIWQNTNTVFAAGSEPDLDEYATHSDIMYASIDVASGAIYNEAITDDNYMDVLPKIACRNGDTYMSWAVNTSDDCFLQNGTTSIITLSDVGGELSVDYYNTTYGVSGLDIGFINNDFVMALALDSDNDFSTGGDIEIYYKHSTGDPIQLTDNEVSDIRPVFTSVNGTDYLMYNSDGSIVYTDLSTSNSVSFINQGVSIDGRFSVVSDADNTSLVWNDVYSDETGDYTCAMASDLSADSTWSNPYMLDILGKQASAATGYIDAGSIYLGYSYVESESTNVAVTEFSRNPDTKIEFVEIGEESTTNPVIISTDVENIGQVGVSSVDVTIYENDISIYSNTISVDIPIGEIRTIEITDFIPPATIAEDNEYRIEVIAADEADNSNNSVDIDLGCPDLFITAEAYNVNGSFMCGLIIGNKTEFTADATLTVRNASEDGEILDSLDIADVSSENNIVMLIEIDRYLDMVDDNVLYFCVSSAKSDKDYGNNSSYIYINDNYISLCDLNYDGTVDLLDVQIAASNYNTVSQEADINFDDIINLFDLVKIAKEVQ